VTAGAPDDERSHANSDEFKEIGKFEERRMPPLPELGRIQNIILSELRPFHVARRALH
jgi:hypothetical protein